MFFHNTLDILTKISKEIALTNKNGGWQDKRERGPVPPSSNTLIKKRLSPVPKLTKKLQPFYRNIASKRAF